MKIGSLNVVPTMDTIKLGKLVIVAAIAVGALVVIGGILLAVLL